MVHDVALGSGTLKLQHGKDEWGDRSVAQWTEYRWTEYRSSEPGVAGSSPAGPTLRD